MTDPDFPGFLYLQLLAPQAGGNAAMTLTFLTAWESRDHFRRYMQSEERAISRSREPAINQALGKQRPLVIVGGRPFLDDPTLATRLGADFTATNAVEAVRLFSERVSPTR